jgi:hypothetical protein
VVGFVTGLIMVVVKVVVHDVEEELLEAEPWIITVVLAVGATTTVLVVRYLAGRSPSTTDRYIEQFHDDPNGVDVRYAPVRRSHPSRPAHRGSRWALLRWSIEGRGS